ncbi:L-2-amino-thiazoline-4-carboxylic acid hydrolase [Aureibacter tunicatorum]|uniref:L-2-amino-thiazoline-4-carboxylic acid hydrolase n=1 Tax=Aureibacter tunicatorum TaxID=866807 RepID=A0AAE3XNW3_9BACT|nr:L-2-amino-thiazoline-4-carboxylic acid hydrolase [Aureibacter tunicatorum]MDR6240018.1 hypothetical protein [Aureibacter tunicatorum]BDD04490.1 hypothetical protein AUTU_19730 [Aureibacter tunicatorum]
MQRFHEAQKMVPNRTDMPPMFQANILKGIYHVMSEEVGSKEAKELLMEAFLWDSIFKRPVWKPELFDLKSKESEKHYKKIFNGLVPFICLFNRFKENYGEERAQYLTALVAVPSAVPYLAGTFKHIENFSDIDQFRQELANYLGDGKGFTWTEEVSDDKTEVRYHFTQCVYIEVLRAYGLTSAAMMSCYCDHIIFDNAMPEIYFKRDHCKGAGDSYCDHCFKIKTEEDKSRMDERYGDTKHADFDAMKVINHWRKNYQDNGGKFKW